MVRDRPRRAAGRRCRGGRRLLGRARRGGGRSRRPPSEGRSPEPLAGAARRRLPERAEVDAGEDEQRAGRERPRDLLVLEPCGHRHGHERNQDHLVRGRARRPAVENEDVEPEHAEGAREHEVRLGRPRRRRLGHLDRLVEHDRQREEDARSDRHRHGVHRGRMDGREPADDDRRLGPADRTREDREHRRPGHARVDPATEDGGDARRSERPARDPLPPEALLALGEREDEREQRYAREQHLRQARRGFHEAPVDEAEPRAELEHAEERRAHCRTPARQLDAQAACDRGEDRGREQEARRRPPERIELAALARHVPDRGSVAARDDDEREKGRERRAIGRSPSLAVVRHAATIRRALRT